MDYLDLVGTGAMRGWENSWHGTWEGIWLHQILGESRHATAVVEREEDEAWL